MNAREKANIRYREASNKHDKIKAYQKGYAEAIKDMQEEMKKFTMGFAYKPPED